MCFRPAEANLSQPIKCPICGKVNRSDAMVCVKCGATAEDMAAALGDASLAAGKVPDTPAAPADTRVSSSSAATPTTKAPNVPSAPTPLNEKPSA